jgi:hypothetical protein
MTPPKIIPDSIKLLKLTKIRFQILRDRMQYCGMAHELSLQEIEGWIEEIDDNIEILTKHEISIHTK